MCMNGNTEDVYIKIFMGQKKKDGSLVYVKTGNLSTRLRYVCQDFRENPTAKTRSVTPILQKGTIGDVQSYLISSIFSDIFPVITTSDEIVQLFFY